MEKKYGIIDLGTNTFHLLVVSFLGEAYSILHRERMAVKLGMGGINQGMITDEGVQRALLCLQAFKKTLEDMGVSTVYAIGTSALRNARNVGEVVARIKSATSIEVDVISGNEEAEYIYQGVRSSLDLGSNKSLIMDIGGGSVEFIIADRNTSYWKESVEIGAQRLLERFQHHDPISPWEEESLEQHLNGSLSSLRDALARFGPTVLVGSSGTFDTLSEIHCHAHGIALQGEERETPLTLESFHGIFKELKSKDREGRTRVPGMIDMRVDMIVVACCLIHYILKLHPFGQIRVSTHSMKEGVLARLKEEASR